MLLTWSCLNSSQLLRTDESLSSDQRTEKANVCARKGPLRLCHPPFCLLGQERRTRPAVWSYLESLHLHQGYRMR